MNAITLLPSYPRMKQVLIVTEFKSSVHWCLKRTLLYPPGNLLHEGTRGLRSPSQCRGGWFMSIVFLTIARNVCFSSEIYCDVQCKAQL